MNQEIVKDLEYWKNNAEEDYMTTPISVLRYISELEKEVESRYTEKEVRDTSLKFFYHWWNEKGNNTEQGFDDWFKKK